MSKSGDAGVDFLHWVLPELGYRWEGFRKPRGQVLQRIHQRIRELDLQGFDEYALFLKKVPEEWNRLEDTLYVTISRFFRDRILWDELSERILPDMVKNNAPSRAGIWSAGCCNGEEPYSIAIAADKSGILNSINIWASDKNPDLLERAKTGSYAVSSLKELSAGERSNYFSFDELHSEYVINPDIRKSVQFEVRNIRGSLPDPDDPFSLVFCRNLVFTYFDETAQLQFLSGIREILMDGGLVIVGSNETLPEGNGWKKVQGNLPLYMKTA